MNESTNERRSMAGRTLRTDDDRTIGTVDAVEGTAMLVNHDGRRIYVPFAAIRSVEGDNVVLSVLHADLDRQGWETPPNEAMDAVSTTTSVSSDEPATAELLGQGDSLPESPYPFERPDRQDTT